MRWVPSRSCHRVNRADGGFVQLTGHHTVAGCRDRRRRGEPPIRVHPTRVGLSPDCSALPRPATVSGGHDRAAVIPVDVPRMPTVELTELVVVHVRRITALFTSVLLLQASLAGGGFACVSHGYRDTGQRQASARPTGHSIMSMVEAHPGGEQHLAGLPGAPTGNCDRGGLLGKCVSMTPCGLVILISPAVEMPLAIMRPVSPPASRSPAPPTHTTAPDLPPPRP